MLGVERPGGKKGDSRSFRYALVRQPITVEALLCPLSTRAIDCLWQVEGAMKGNSRRGDRDLYGCPMFAAAYMGR